MNRLKATWPRIALIVFGVAIGLLARQTLGPPDERVRPKRTIDRPISKDVELGDEPAGYIPVDLPLSDLPVSDLPADTPQPQQSR